MRGMRIAALIWLLGMLWPPTSFAGTIIGTVAAKGVPEASEQAGDGKYQSRRYKFVEKVDYARLTDFVVYIDQPLTNAALARTSRATVITQKDATFRPRVLAVQVGTTVEWPNEDDIFHNVFSASETKSFNLGLYKDKSPTVVFDKSGRVDVFCGIHTKMYCIVLVLPSPYFAVTGEKGRFALKDVPAGVYKVKAWHERMPSQVKEVTVAGNGETKVDFVLGFSELPKE